MDDDPIILTSKDKNNDDTPIVDSKDCMKLCPKCKHLLNFYEYVCPNCQYDFSDPPT